MRSDKGRIGGVRYWWNGSVWIFRGRARRLNRKARKAAKVIFVSLYDTNRAYGGPEEGGWWFDYGTPIPRTAESFFNEDNACARGRVLNAACDAVNKGRGYRGDIGSVCCEGALRACMDWGKPPSPFPDRTPHYE